MNRAVSDASRTGAIVPQGRVSEAARARGCEPRAQAPHQPGRFRTGRRSPGPHLQPRLRPAPLPRRL